MDTRPIGSLDVSVVGLGCNNFGGRLGAEETAEVVLAAIDAGVTFFDTADMYGDSRSEEFLGRALDGRRDEVLVATKFGYEQGGHPDVVAPACEASLKRLGMDVIDLYQLHKPDPGVPIAETLGAMQELVDAGKVREIGHSNLGADEVREAHAAAGDDTEFVSAQDQWSLLSRDFEDERLVAARESGLAVLPFFPLESGVLTGKYFDGDPEGARLTGRDADDGFRNDANLATARELAGLARDAGHSLLDLAIGWLLAQSIVASVIAGATKPEQVRANAAAGQWIPDRDILAEVDRITGRG